ncbi:MotA/TolQ/ExbB proton channel family protein [Neogemmobacter tilapiae]|uniref:Flagellar motor protein MotA n=1 Tax=Neogemmobacter tilapiae TaxID=875041 RepID=A0A918TWD5_9RHOB|nr:MotA/TolQ/ExbB proton channel family protein [Gemmobacter tilapiae]GHC63349.1 flagellar motor protein MotA [Gemmobacter tilapiae]
MELHAATGAEGLWGQVLAILAMGGLPLWTIAFLSVVTVTLILWKAMRLLSLGAWTGRGRANRAVDLWQAGQRAQARALVEGKSGTRFRLIRAAMDVATDDSLTSAEAEAEVTRVARRLLAEAQAGLRGLELAAVLGPLLGLMGTVTGMIASFKSLQAAGANADPATLAGGIWELLITTAAGMGVAIPAQVALTWYESVTDRLALDMEDNATRILARRMARVDSGTHEVMPFRMHAQAAAE